MPECPGCGGYNVHKVFVDGVEMLGVECHDCGEYFDPRQYDDDGTDGNGDDVPNGRH